MTEGQRQSLITDGQIILLSIMFGELGVQLLHIICTIQIQLADLYSCCICTLLTLKVNRNLTDICILFRCYFTLVSYCPVYGLLIPYCTIIESVCREMLSSPFDH